jgi:ribonuclease HI
MGEVAALYADGGCLGANPSPHGGSWAWVHVSAAGEVVAKWSGFVTPADVGLDRVSNNVTELIGLLHGLEALPEGWAGKAYTDSNVTRLRFDRPWQAKFKGVPQDLIDRVRDAVERVADCEIVLLGGHPTKAELAAGVRADGMPVSKWNVVCDAECCRVIADRRATLTRETECEATTGP